MTDQSFTRLKLAEIHADLFSAQSQAEVKKLLLILPAMGVKKSLYHAFARFMQQQDYHVLVLNYPGIEAQAKQAQQYALTDWAKVCLVQAYRAIDPELKSLDKYVLCHSIGGQLLGLLEFAPEFKRIVHVASQSGYWRLWPKSQRCKYALLWYLLMPGLTHLCGYMPAKRLGLGENLPKAAALQWADWCRQPGYLFDCVDYAQSAYDRLSQPSLIYSFSDDPYAPEKAVSALHQHYRHCKRKQLHLSPEQLNLDKIGHFGFFKQPQLWQQTVDWLKLS